MDRNSNKDEFSSEFDELASGSNSFFWLRYFSFECDVASGNK
jgi:hypothetical protein